MNRIRIVDSHTGGEPTRVIVEGGPDLGGGSLAERRERFRTAHDHYRRGIVTSRGALTPSSVRCSVRRSIRRARRA
jgi:Proline racemase